MVLIGLMVLIVILWLMGLIGLIWRMAPIGLIVLMGLMSLMELVVVANLVVHRAVIDARGRAHGRVEGIGLCVHSSPLSWPRPLRSRNWFRCHMR